MARKNGLKAHERHIDALMEMGGEDVVGFGSDFDGISVWPENLANPADFPNLIEALRRHGYADARISDWKNAENGDAEPS